MVGEIPAARRYQGCGSYDELLEEVRLRGDDLLKCSLHAAGESEYRELRSRLADALDDVTLAQSDVGVGIAMGNSIEPVRRAAAMLVADSDHDGVAEAIDMLIAA